MAVAPAPPRLAARHDAPAAERGGIDAAASDVSRSVAAKAVPAVAVARRRSEHECGAAERAGRDPPGAKRSEISAVLDDGLSRCSDFLGRRGVMALN